MQQDLYHYFDYQELLRDFYASEKSVDGLFSYRVFAEALGMDASLLVKVLQGKRHLSREGTESVIRFFRYDSKQALYFRELVSYGKASRDEDVKKHFESLLRMRPTHCSPIDEDRYRYFQHWYFPAVRSALDVFAYHGEKDAGKLAGLFKPALQKAQVIEAVEVLERLGLLRMDSLGRYCPAVAHLSTGERWQSAAVREYQRQLIGLAADSIEGVERQDRDISSLTLALDASQMERIRAVLAEARRSIVRQVDAMPPSECNAVYLLNIQLFPVMRLENPL